MLRHDPSCGFTLLELILVIVIIGILGMAVYPVAIASVNAYNATLMTANTVDKLRYASERIAFEIRELNVNSITSPLSSPNGIVFSRDDYYNPSPNATVTIGLKAPVSTAKVNPCNNQVQISYGAVPTVPTAMPLTDQTCSLTFSYFDLTGVNPAMNANDVRYIEFTLALNTSVGNKQASKEQYSQTTRVALRNR